MEPKPQLADISCNGHAILPNYYSIYGDGMLSTMSVWDLVRSCCKNEYEHLYKQECQPNGIYLEERRGKRGTMEEDEEQ